MRAATALVIASSSLVGCGRLLYAEADAAAFDAPGLDAPGLDAPGLDAPELDALGLDAPGLDAPDLDAGPDAAIAAEGGPADDVLSRDAPRADAPPEILCATASFTSYADVGTGAPGDPYVICNATQWESFLTDGPEASSYRVGADLDLASDVRRAVFVGELDGGGHVVTNHAFWTGPLFGVLNGGSVHDLRLSTNVDAQTSDQVGAIAGSSSGTLARVSVVADFVSGATDTGGLVGLCTGCTIADASVIVSRISGLQNVGGVAGSMTGGSVTRARVEVLQLDARISSGCGNVGGVVGAMPAGGTLSELHAHVALVGAGVGGIVGDAGGGADVRDVIADGSATRLGTGCSFGAGGLAGSSRGTFTRGWARMTGLDAGLVDHLGLGGSVLEVAGVSAGLPTASLAVRTCDAGTSLPGVVALDDGSGGAGTPLCGLAVTSVASEPYFWSSANPPMSSWSTTTWDFSPTALPTLRNVPP